jgi:hypothetical protein
MKIKFLRGFQGRETRNIWFEAGKVVDMQDEDMAELLVREGRAVLVNDDGSPLEASVAGSESFAEPSEAPLGPMPEGNDVPVVLPEPKKRGRKRGAK